MTAIFRTILLSLTTVAIAFGTAACTRDRAMGDGAMMHGSDAMQHGDDHGRMSDGQGTMRK